MILVEMKRESKKSTRATMTRAGHETPIAALEASIPVRRVPGALARRFFQICATAAADELAAAGVTALEHAAMAYLNKSDGEPGLDQNSLAARLAIDRNSTSRLVEQLASKGLLEREVKQNDRRARLLRLSAGGEALHKRLFPGVLAAQERTLAALKRAERDLLLDLLVRVIEANRPAARGPRRRRAGRTPARNVRTHRVPGLRGPAS